MKKIALIAALACIALVSCKKEAAQDWKPTGALSIHALSIDTHAGISGINMEIIGEGIKGTTDGNGAVVFRIHPGDYEVKVTSSNYLDVIMEVTVDLANGESEHPVAVNTAKDVFMYPTTATLKGSVMADLDDDGTYEYQEGATVKINSGVTGLSFITPFTAITDADGGYEISNLPEGMDLTVKAEYIYNGKYYTGTSAVSEIPEGLTSIAPTVKMSVGSGNSYTPDIITMPASATSPVVFTFPVAADPSNTGNSFQVYRTSTSETVAVSVDWSNNNRTVSISSVDDEGWSDYSYGYDITAYTASGDILYSSDYFYVAGQQNTGQIANVTGVNYDSLTSTIRWTELSNADGYIVWVKASGVKDYVYHANTSNTEMIMSLPAGTYLVKVTGYNSEYDGSVASAAAVSMTI